MAQNKLYVVPYDPKWEVNYKREAAHVARILEPLLTAIHHIGSTSIEGMAAKPTIDILAEVHDLSGVDAFTGKLSQAGYEALGEYGIRRRRYFEKKDSSGGHLVHLHVFEAESEDVVRHLAFRDYLRMHDDDATCYSQIKIKLAEQFSDDRESYQVGKNELCRHIEQRALQWWYDA